MSELPSQQVDLDAVYRATVGADLRTVAVAAPAAGQGASTLALALASRAAGASRSTLLVELTTRGSAVTERFGTPRAGWDQRPESAAAAIVSLGPDLSALPSPSLGRPAPLLREAAALRLLREDWLARFQLVILDLPPVLSANPHDIDAITAASVADGVIVSVLARVTTEAELIKATEQLRRADVPVLGAVVNDRDNPTLGDEIAREMGRIESLAPVLISRLADWVRSRQALQRRL